MLSKKIIKKIKTVNFSVILKVNTIHKKMYMTLIIPIPKEYKTNIFRMNIFKWMINNNLTIITIIIVILLHALLKNARIKINNLIIKYIKKITPFKMIVIILNNLNTKINNIKVLIMIMIMSNMNLKKAILIKIMHLKIIIIKKIIMRITLID